MPAIKISAVSLPYLCRLLSRRHFQRHFFKKDDLPAAARQAGAVRVRLLMRVLGSPDPYGKQMDGLGNGSSSTSKALLIY